MGKLGALGHGNNDDNVIPSKIAGLEGIVKVECGAEYTMALDSNG